MLSGDLTRTAAVAMTDGEEGLRDIGFEIFRPILPMLASTAESVGDAVESFDLASVEWKLDGIRIQIHRRGEEVRIYTRNLNDITTSCPGPSTRSSTAGEAGGAGRRGTLDGTTVPARSRTRSRGSTATRRRGITTFLFDLLHVDGEDLLDTPLARARGAARGDRAAA